MHNLLYAVTGTYSDSEEGRRSRSELREDTVKQT